MSQTIVTNTGNQAHITTDTSKIFVGNNRYDTFEYNNDTYVDVDLTKGQLMGEIAATRKVVPLNPDASDGSQLPIGIMANDHVAEAGTTINVSLCVSGDVVENQILLAPDVNLNDVIDGRTLRQRIGTDTVGVKLVGGTELTNYDNQ